MDFCVKGSQLEEREREKGREEGREGRKEEGEKGTLLAL